MFQAFALLPVPVLAIDAVGLPPAVTLCALAWHLAVMLKLARAFFVVF